MQITPDGDYTRTGVAWNKIGYASPAHSQHVEAPERTGLYYFHARTNSGREFSFPWVVAPATPTAAVAVLMSNITWNAYNNFGGRSNYIHADEFPATPTVNARQELKRYISADHQTWGCDSYAPLSFDRPEPINHIDLAERITDPIEGSRRLSHRPRRMAHARLAGAGGSPHDVYAETQFDRGVLDLSKYRVLMICAIPNTGLARCTTASSGGSSRRGAA